MQKLAVLFFLVGNIVFALTSCKDDCNDPTNPDCKNYDPCHGSSFVVAGFKIEEQVGNELIIETDTVYWGNTTVFTPTSQYDSVKWLIGSESTTEKILKRKEFPKNQWINVTLIAYKKPNTNCYPTDDGVDTLTKQFYSLTNEFRLIYGYFQGYNTDNPSDTFTIRTVIDDTVLGKKLDLYNLPKECKDNFFCEYSEAGGRSFYTRSGNNGPGHRFALKTAGSVRGNTISIEYSFNEEAMIAWKEGRPPQTPRRVIKTFIGKRL